MASATWSRTFSHCFGFTSKTWPLPEVKTSELVQDSHKSRLQKKSPDERGARGGESRTLLPQKGFALAYLRNNYARRFAPTMHTENTNSNAAPMDARSLAITVNISPAQAAALAAFAGDRGITQADALLLLAFVKINTGGSLSEEAGFIDAVSQIVLTEGRAGDVEDGEPFPYESLDIQYAGNEAAPSKPLAPGEGIVPMIGGKPFKGFAREDEGEGWKQD